VEVLSRLLGSLPFGVGGLELPKRTRAENFYAGIDFFLFRLPGGWVARLSYARVSLWKLARARRELIL
jgi:hypothetical protein